MPDMTQAWSCLKEDLHLDTISWFIIHLDKSRINFLLSSGGKPELKKTNCGPIKHTYTDFCLVAKLPLCVVGECYLTDWTVWSPCQLSCVSGDDLGFGSVQVRSRAVVAQDPENLLQCPEQQLEARPCTGESNRALLKLMENVIQKAI